MRRLSSLSNPILTTTRRSKVDNHVRHNLRLIRNQLEELDEFVLNLRDGFAEPVIPSFDDRLHVEVTMGEVLEQLDSLIDHSPRFTPQPVRESDYVCCS